MAETLAFVTKELDGAEPDESLGEYAIALNFSSRAGNTYESRGTAIASDLVNGRHPEAVRAYR